MGQARKTRSEKRDRHRNRRYTVWWDMYVYMCMSIDVVRLFIAGSLIHFGFASALIWWLCSIFNVFVSVYAVSPVNPIIRYSKVVFIVEAFMSVMVPIALVSVVLGVHGKYTMFSDQIIVCGPPSLSLFYFSMVLPGQLTVLLGIVMIALIWLRLQKVIH
jgi:hypothetical protein